MLNTADKKVAGLCCPVLVAELDNLRQGVNYCGKERSSSGWARRKTNAAEGGGPAYLTKSYYGLIFEPSMTDARTNKQTPLCRTTKCTQ